MAEKTINSIKKIGKTLFFEKYCEYCSTKILVKKRNQKYCDTTCKQLSYTFRKLQKEQGELLRQSIINNQIINLSKQIRSAVETKNFKLADELQQKKDDLLKM